MPKAGPSASCALWEHGQVFWAAKDDLLVRVQQLHRDGSEPSIVVQVHPAEPRRVAVSGFAALGAGVLIGWMLACWTLRRLARHGPLGKALILSAGLPALAATSLLVVFMLGGLGSLFAYWGWAERHLIYPTQVIGESLPLALLAFGASAAALFAAALPIRPGAGRWRAVIAVAFLAALTVLVAYVAYRIIS